MATTCMTTLTQHMQAHGYCIKTGTPSPMMRSIDHDGVGLLYMRQGICRFVTEDYSVTLTPHTGVIFDNSVKHTTLYVKNRIGRTVIHLSHDIVDAAAYEHLFSQDTSRPKGKRVQGFRFPTPAAEMRFHWAVLHLSSLLEQPTSRAAALHLAGLVLSEMQPCASDRALPLLLQKAIDYMKHHLNVDDTVADVANKVYCSESHLRRLFEQYLGNSPRNYWLNLKIDHATQMLSDGASIGRVAQETGFSSRRGFEKAFIRMVGISPHEYAQMYDDAWSKELGFVDLGGRQIN